MKCTVERFGGVPTLMIDGKPHNGLAHWNRRANRLDAAAFHQAGIDIFSFMGTLAGDRVYFGTNLACPQFSPENIDAIMGELIEANPEILVLPRIKLLCPEQWLTDFPDEFMCHYNLGTRTFFRGDYPALQSERWRRYVADGVAQIIRHFEEKWGDHVIGYHTGCGHCAEHAYRWESVISDYSAIHLQHYRQWLRNEYGSVSRLNDAWKTSFPSFETVRAPEPDAFTHCPYGEHPTIYIPESDLQVVDWMRYLSQAMADAILFQAQIVKGTLRSLHREKIFGVFYGYANYPANSITWFSRGMHAQKRVFESPDIDFISAPLDYTARQNGGFSGAQLLPGSVAAYGKLYYAEDDTHTPLQNTEQPPSAEIMDRYLQVCTRNFLDVMQHGGTLWWMALLRENWFRDQRIMDKLRELRQFADRYLNMRGSVAEIAVFLSDESADYFRGAPIPFMGNLLGVFMEELSAVGAPFDIYNLEDLPLLDVSQYKFCILPNLLVLDAEQEAWIERRLKNGNRTLLWLHLPGLIRNHAIDVGSCERLTGFRFGLDNAPTRNPLRIEAAWRGQRWAYGESVNFTPRLCGQDADYCLGYYANATGKADPAGALMRKKNTEWRSIWSAAAGIPASLLEAFLREAGVTLYAPGHQVAAAPGWLGIHAKFSDTISFERFGNTYSCRMQRGKTYLWEFPDGKTKTQNDNNP